MEAPGSAADSEWEPEQSLGIRTHRGRVCFYLRQPVVLRSSIEDWNLTLWSSRCETLLHPECGMTTVLVSVVSASRMMFIFTASHEDRFQRTPEGGQRVVR